MMKKIIAFLMASMMLFGVALAADFTDIAADHWAYGYVEELVTNGVINGYTDNTFRPGNNVTRAELAKMITLQFGNAGTKAYSDVAETEWYYSFVTNSGDYFITEGEFFPMVHATREEVAYAIYVAKDLPGGTGETGFTDAQTVYPDYQKAVAAAAENGIINGYPDGTFRPKNNITRAEVAAILSRALNLGTKTNYEEVLTMAKLLGGTYSANDTISYGALSQAALRMYNNEWTLAYYNLGDVVNKEPFEHEAALSFWIIGRDVLGEGVVTKEKIDTPISVKEAVDVMVYYSERHDYLKRTIDKSLLLNGVDTSKPLTQAVFAQLVTEIDEQIPMLIKVVVNSGKSAQKIPTAIRKDASTYPTNRATYQAILEEVPNAVYESPYPIASGSLKGSYDFAREMMSFLLHPVNQFCQIAEEKGAKINIHYYPSLVQGKDNVFTMRVKLEVVSVNGDLALSDVCNTKLTRKIKAGDSFFCDINTNAKVPSTSLNGGVLTIEKIYE